MYKHYSLFLQLLCVGPTGSGKTLTIADKLLKNMPPNIVTEFFTFSVRTSANQTQDLFDSKLTQWDRPITTRLTRHFNYLSFTEMEDSSKMRIFSIILESWLC